MWTADGTRHRTPARRVPTLDASRPLALWHTARLTVAVVSIAWLRALSDPETACLGALSEREAARLPTLPSRRRRTEWLAGRLAVKHAVGAYQRRRWGSAAPPRDIHVHALTGGPLAGKPVVDVPAEVGLSHSGDFAVAACGPHAVGVDVEHRAELPPMVAALVAPGEHGLPERGRLPRMPPPLRWACKEAVLKHYGIGLRVDTRNVRLTDWRPDGSFRWRAGPQLLRHAPAADHRPPHGWAARVDGYALALVWQSGTQEDPHAPLPRPPAAVHGGP